VSTSNLQPEDKKAAMTGLVITAVLLFLMAYGIVLWTNAQFAGGEHAKGAAPAGQQH
jgi:hypothetical protein